MQRPIIECSLRAYWVDSYSVTLRGLLQLIFFLLCVPFIINAQVAPVRHVIVIGIDGLSSNGVQHAGTPILDSIVQRAAYTWKCEAVLPTSSSPNWASMIMGATPAKHGVTSNAWQPHKQTIELECEGTRGNGKPSGMWPTIFGELRRQRPESTIACFNEWPAFNRLFEKGVANRQRDANLFQMASHTGYKGIIKKTTRYFEKEKPDLLFVHLDLVDHAGHHSGHGSSAYYAAVSKADGLIGKIVNAVKRAGLADETAILITADHGGIGYGHGGDTPEERYIPWILTGASAVGGKIDVEVRTFDTAPTLAHLLGIKAPQCWEGKVITEAVEH